MASTWVYIWKNYAVTPARIVVNTATTDKTDSLLIQFITNPADYSNKYTKEFDPLDTEAISNYTAELEILLLIGGIYYKKPT